jgi:hypothetical protein
MLSTLFLRLRLSRVHSVKEQQGDAGNMAQPAQGEIFPPLELRGPNRRNGTAWLAVTYSSPNSCI